MELWHCTISLVSRSISLRRSCFELSMAAITTWMRGSSSLLPYGHEASGFTPYCVGEKVTMHATKIRPKIITHRGHTRSHQDSDSLELISISSRSYSNGEFKMPPDYDLNIWAMPV